MSNYVIHSAPSRFVFFILIQIVFLLSICPAFGQQPSSKKTFPKSTLGARPIFIDRASEALEYFGADVDFHFYNPGLGNSADSMGGYSPDHITTQLGAGANIFIAFASDQEFKFNLSGITLGPELRFSKGIFSTTIFLQGGIAKDQVKFDDYKDHESSFALRTGITIDCWFSNKVAVDVAPQALMTKFEDKSDWNFMVGLGVVFKLGEYANK